jgi:tetratricopeptide (TPR) repeat protein
MTKKLDTHILLPACVLIFVTFLLSTTALAPTDYFVNDDEGNYLKQAKTIIDSGIVHGSKTLGKNYLSGDAYNTPAPTRLLHTLYTAPFVWATGGIAGLSWAAGVAFLAALLLGFWAFERLFGVRTALAWLALAAISPLHLAMARRALMDAPQTAFLFATILCFVFYIKHNTPKKFYILLLLTSLAPLYKETNLLLIPIFIAIILYMYIIDKQKINYIHLLLLCIMPLCAWLLGIWFIFDNWDNVTQFFNIYKTAIAAPPTSIQFGTGAYNHQFGSGGWAQYPIDFLSVSPLIFIIFLLAIGYSVALYKTHSKTLLHLFLITLLLYIGYNLFTKNIRYVLILDPLMRLFIAVFLVNIWQKIEQRNQAKKIFIAALVLVAAADLWQFKFYFIDKKIYDPTAYNLLTAQKIIPYCTTPTPAQAGYALPQSYSDYIYLSLEFYNKKNYAGCIAASAQALVLNPQSSEAYNNMGAAYNDLTDYDNAIAVLEQALKLNPNNIFAANGLKYARQMQQNNTKN